jgi:hypothetical protein
MYKEANVVKVFLITWTDICIFLIDALVSFVFHFSIAMCHTWDMYLPKLNKMRYVWEYW